MYFAITLIVAMMVVLSGTMKIRRHPRVVQSVHEIIGLRLTYFPFLAAYEFAGAFGLVLGILWPLIGIASGVALVLYFVGAILSHLRVHDFKGVVPGMFMLVAVAIVLIMRLHLGPHPHWYRF